MNLHIGKIELGHIPRVVNIISDKDILILDTKIIECIDILEIRIDMFEEFSTNSVAQKFNLAKTRFDKPIIATIRDPSEGGYSTIDDKYKCELFNVVMPFSDAVDIEINSSEMLRGIIPLYKNHNKLIIGSYHNFNNTPDIEDLTDIVLRAEQYGADITKIAVMANTRNDMAKLISFTINNRDRNLITISLGSIGQISRILNPIIGSLMTYGYINSPSAPGQISAMDIINYLKIFDPEYKHDKKINIF